MKPIIRVQNLGKQYRLGGSRAPYRTLRDTLASIWPTSLRGRKGAKANDDRLFWALKEVGFEVEPGEVVGIVGRNGAGKSTLLKILSRITDPTTGCVDLYGRVGSLLEVGTGFHLELSGGENIFLNGAILGMKRAEIRRKFDEIVAFAGVERFIDNPVKQYSSGMQMRLAFAVAAHLEPEILITDEVLAVGDAEFQRKCIGKMREVAGAGRTVLFVSHNMAAVRSLCRSGILLKEGQIAVRGSIEEAVRGYLEIMQDQGGECKWTDEAKAPGDECVRLRSVRLINRQGECTGSFKISEPIAVEIDYQVLRSNLPLDTFCYFADEYGGIRFLTLDNLDSRWADSARPAGLYRSVCQLPPHFLNEGVVRVHVALRSNGNSHTHAMAPDIVSFRVVDDMDPIGVRGNYLQTWPEAAVRPRIKWDVTCLRAEESLTIKT